MSEEYTEFKLRKPLKVDGTDVSMLKMREPVVDDAIVAHMGKEEDAIKELNLIANLCEISPEDLRKLNLKDYRKLQKHLMDLDFL